MPAPIFVSYNWSQGHWVWDRLIPVLEAGGGEILFDRGKFEAARALERQMDDLQDRAGLNVLVFSPEYLLSSACQREMKRAIARDPKFETGVAIPILRTDCTLPAAIKRPNPLYVDLRDDSKPEPWHQLLSKCGLDVGLPAHEWLGARDLVRTYLARGESVNLVVAGKAQWRPLLKNLCDDDSLRLGVVRLDSTEAMHRPTLVRAILTECGCPPALAVPDRPEDLVMLGRSLKALDRAPRLALTSFDLVTHRIEHYGLDLFVALRDLTMDARKLTLLIISHTPFATLLPGDHPLSEINLKTVDLKGRA